MQQQKKHYCSNCKSNNNHQILHKETINSDNPDYFISWEYYMLKCMGCESISFRIETIDYENDFPDEYGDSIPNTSVLKYPLTLENHNNIDEVYLLPQSIYTIYTEAIEAMKTNCFLLAGVGYRAVIEAICINQNVTGRNLQTKINNLLKNRFITDNEAKRLHAIRFMGNDSIHDMEAPKIGALYAALRIIDNLLNNLYIIDNQTKSHLNTIIDDKNKFINLLRENLENFNSGDDYPLLQFLKKDARRLDENKNFNTILIDAINNGEFDLLSIGDIKPVGNSPKTIQHFIKK